MTPSHTTKISRFLSLVLRHKPDEIGITLDEAGWVIVADLLNAMNRKGPGITLDVLKHIVENNDKKRFEFSPDGARIRASQGHSVEVDLQYAPATPPEVLYHGTVERFLDSIRKAGLVKGKRHHVHLSKDEQTATVVGARRGEAVILKINAGQMAKDGMLFYVSTNGVWLTENVPANYIEFPS